MTDTNTTAPETEAPIPTPMHVAPPQDPEVQKVWQEFLQKCCESGQISFQLTQLDSQKAVLEKQLDVTNRAIKSAAAKHRELQAAALKKPVDNQ